MARTVRTHMSKVVAQIAALTLVIGALAAFVVTQTIGAAPTAAQEEGSESGEAPVLDLELASAVQPLSPAENVQSLNIVALNVTRAGEDSEILVKADTVGQALDAAGVEYTEQDQISPALDEAVSDGDSITIKVVETTEVTEEETIAHETKRENDNTMDRGTTSVETEGVDGVETVTYQVTTVDGEETEREEVSREVTKEPVTELVKVGTKEEAPAQNQASSSNSGGTAPSSGVWARLAQCESGGNWHINTGNGYYGGLQFSGATWNAMGGQQYAPTADQASPSEQIAVATKLQQRAGWGQWPACSRQLGLR